MKKKNGKYIIFAGGLPSQAKEKALNYANNNGFTMIILKHENQKKYINKILDNVLCVDFSKSDQLESFVKDYEKSIIAVTARGDSHIPYLKKIIPLLPKNLLLPSVDALTKATEKPLMRKAFKKYNKHITPKFELLTEFSQEHLEKISQKFEFPVVVKPSGLAQARLVQAAHYPEELYTIVKDIFKKSKKLYKEIRGRGIPSILIEEIIEGTQFSVDAFINNDEEIFFTPFVRYTTSNQKGFDDFFSYEQSTPANLKNDSAEKAKEIASQGIKALGLKNSAAHIEMMRDINGDWKIIEIGPRLGGFRSMMYEKSFGIKLDDQDINIRLGKKVRIPNKRLGFTSVIKFFAKEEGTIIEIKGIQKAKKLPSFYNLHQIGKKGDKATFAKNGGNYVFRVTLFNTDKKKLIEDKRKLEKMVHITTSKNKSKK